MNAIIVGSGPNGLAASIALAQAGWAVRVLEGQPTIGGGVRSAELTLPGFVHDRCSAIYPLAVGSPFFRTLPLPALGVEWIHSPFPLAHPFVDGTAAVLCRSVEETGAGLGLDESAYRSLMKPLVRHWEALADEFLQPLLHWPRHPMLMARFGSLALRSARDLALSRFQTKPARALFAGLAAHSFLELEAPASAAYALMLALFGHAVGWPLPRGGAQRLSDALATHFRGLGGVVETGQQVTALDDVSSGTDVTLLDTTVWQAARLAGNRLPWSLGNRLQAFPHGPSVFKVDYALDEPIPWTAEQCHQAATVHLGNSLEEIAEAERDVAQGRVPDRPFVLLAQPTLFDPSRAPAGKHIAWAYCHVPRGCTIDMTSAIEDQIERFAPGFRRIVIGRHILRPSDLATSNANLSGGDITGGACDLWHMFARPTFSPAPYRLERRKLYLCSSSTPPGGGVHGMCGYRAAQTVLSDFQVRLE